MLIENKTLNGKVVTFKLASGEEVIARMVEDLSANGTIRIKNPLSMIMMNDEANNQGMVAFAPWILGAEDNVVLTVNTNNVVVLLDARPDAAEQYSQAVGEEVTPTPKVTPLQSFGGRRGGRGGRG